MVGTLLEIDAPLDVARDTIVSAVPEFVAISPTELGQRPHSFLHRLFFRVNKRSVMLTAAGSETKALFVTRQPRGFLRWLMDSDSAFEQLEFERLLEQCRAALEAAGFAVKQSVVVLGYEPVFSAPAHRTVASITQTFETEA